jgi:hypothetical protein
MVGRKKKIDKIVFADNGHGMKEDVLHKCLKLGHSFTGFEQDTRKLKQYEKIIEEYKKDHQ